MKEEIIMLKIRKAHIDDLDQIMSIYHSAQDFMIKSGNPNQWGKTHPTKELITNDIKQEINYVIYDESGIHGIFVLLFTPEPTYTKIYDGAWLNNNEYVTIHRIASDGKVCGIFNSAINYAKSFGKDIRIDTHEDNKVMQRHIEASGFIRCGIIYLLNGAKRIAYELNI